MTPINEIFKKIRELKGDSQSELADKMKKTQSAYARYELGKTKIDFETIMLFANTVNMSVVDVITFPEKWGPLENREENEETRVTLQIELKKEKKDQVLKLAFGENILEILNK
jgi:transcriptional regulator with XRE-family HTH domain